MKLKRIILSIVLLLCTIALPVFAGEMEGERRITPETTIGEIRQDPGVIGAGIWTYQKAVEDGTPEPETTLKDYVGENMAQDCADALNYLVSTYNSGRQVTYKVYTPEQIAEDSARDEVELYFFPAEVSGGKYVLVMSGNVLNKTANLSEGYATAWQLHELGYNVFVLRYRVFQQAKNNAPIDDLGHALEYITQNAGTLGVQAEDYALLGYSSGGHLAGIFANREKGYGNYAIPKPGALLLGYPINDFFEYKPVYHLMMDPQTLKERYYEWTISDCVEDGYPPVYHWYGSNDYVFPLLWYPAQRPALTKALQEHQVPYKEVIYRDATHGVGTGKDTDADGWLADAVSFWEEQTS